MRRIDGLLFSVDGAAAVSNPTVEDGEVAVSDSVRLIEDESITVMMTYTSDVAVDVVVETLDKATNTWIDIEGAEFVAEELPILTPAAPRAFRVAGLPVLERIRFKLSPDGGDITVSQWDVITNS